MNELNSKIVSAFERISEVIKNLRIAYGKKLGISPIQIQILFYLRKKIDCAVTLTELATYFQLTKPTISDSLFNLETKGYIHKVQSQQDRRNDLIALTNKGIEHTQKLENYLQPIENTFSELTAEDREKLYFLLLEIIFSLYKSGHIKAQNMCFSCKFYEINEVDGSSYCKLMEKPLTPIELRLDCPDYEKNEI